VLIYNANNNLTDEQKNFENEMEEYKSSLLIYNYEKEFIFQKLDTVVAEKEIEKYYESHPNDFQLKENISCLLSCLQVVGICQQGTVSLSCKVKQYT
jgi:hypothetical protein